MGNNCSALCTNPDVKDPTKEEVDNLVRPGIRESSKDMVDTKTGHNLKANNHPDLDDQKPWETTQNKEPTETPNSPDEKYGHEDGQSALPLGSDAININSLAERDINIDIWNRWNRFFYYAPGHIFLSPFEFYQRKEPCKTPF